MAVKVFFIVDPYVGVECFFYITQSGAGGYAVACRVGCRQKSVFITGAVAVCGHAVEASLKGQGVEYACIDRHAVIGKYAVGMTCFVSLVGIVLIHILSLYCPSVGAPAYAAVNEVHSHRVGA